MPELSDIIFAVWHSQLAGWVNNINDPAELTQVIQEHIAAVMGRYKGKIHHWVRNITTTLVYRFLTLLEIGCSERNFQ